MAGQTPGQIGLSIVGGVIGGYFGGYPGFMVGASLGGMLGRMIDPPDAPKPPPLGDITVNTYNRNSPLSVCYGQCKVGGGVTMRDKGSIGYDKDGGDKGEDPTYTVKMSLRWAVAHCEGPIIGLASPERFWIDDKVTVRGGDAEDGGNFGFTFYIGEASPAVDAYWNSFYSGQLPPPPYKFTCYHSVSAHVHGSTFSSIPSFSAELRGFLTETGEQDANPIRVAYDWLTNARYAVGLSPDALNGDPDTVGSPWKDAADYCDALVSYTDRNGDPAQEPRFRYSNVVDAPIKGYDFLSDLMNSCRGILRYKNGLIEPLIEHGDQEAEYYYSDRVKVSFVTGGGTTASRIYADFSAYPLIYWRGAIGTITIGGETMDFGIKDQTATYIDLCVDLPSNPGSGINFTITKDNIKENSFSFKELGDNEVPNLARVEFERRQVWDVNKGEYANEYQWDAVEQEVPELYTWSSSGFRQNIKKIKTIRYSGVKRSTQAMRMVQFLADAIYFARWLCTFTTGIEGYQHAVGDIIGVTHIQAAWSNKWFRIIKMEEQEGDEIQLDCIEYNPNVYNDEVNIQDYEPNYDDQGGSSWTVPDHVERFIVVQDLVVSPGTYKFFVFFKRPDNNNYWFGAKVYVVGMYGDEYVDSFTIPTPSVKLSASVNWSQTTIPFDASTLYGTFPASGSFYIRWEKISYSSISGNSFIGCTRAANGYGGEHNSNQYCNLYQNETPYILTDNRYAGLEITLKAVSFVSAGVSAPSNTAPTYPVWVSPNEPPPPPDGGP